MHEALGATFTDCAGWWMPAHYSDEDAEGVAIRRTAGLVDLTHLARLRFTGSGAGAALGQVLFDDESPELAPARARSATVRTDLPAPEQVFAYRLADEDFLVTGSVTAAAELVERVGRFGFQPADVTEDYALLAVQGPRSAAALAPSTNTDLYEVARFSVVPSRVAGCGVWLARTGSTGQDGFELFVTADAAVELWQGLAESGAPHGISPVGLSGWETLRREASPVPRD